MTATTTAAIVGAGIAGRLTAWHLLEQGWEVTLFDQAGPDGAQSCSFAAGGMLAPWSELEVAEPLVFQLGKAALELWPGIAQSLINQGQTVYFEQRGSLIVAHPRDEGELDRLERRVRAERSNDPVVRGQALADLEPDLTGRFHRGLYFPEEGHVGTRMLLVALGQALEAQGATLHWNTSVTAVAPHQVSTAAGPQRYDWVVDARGLGGRPDQPRLRGVRGELIAVHAPEVTLQRPVRVMHPRYSIYVVPRPERYYLIGATSIESEDLGPVTVRSSLELLSAAYMLHTGFAEARLVDLVVQLRPAFPDNLPRIQWQPGLVRINGLFRHGYLLGPSIAAQAVALLQHGKPPEGYGELFHAEG